MCGESDFSFEAGREDAPATVVAMELIAGFLPANQSPELWDMGRLLDLRLGIDGLPDEVRGGMSVAGPSVWKLEFES